MKVVIDGVKYGLEESVTKATLGDLYVLKVKLGVSVKSISATFGRLGGMTAMDMLDDAEVLLNLQGVIWLARRKAGEPLTVEEAGEVPFTDLSIEDDDEVGADVEAPKVLTDSGLVESSVTTRI